MSFLYLTSYYISLMKQFYQVLSQIIVAPKAKYMTIIAKNPHFNLMHARMYTLTPQPQVTIQPALTRHGRGELKLRLKDNTRLYRECLDWAKLFHRFK